MQHFQSFMNKRCRFEDVFRMADQLGLDSTECISPATKVLHSLKRESFGKNMERKLSYIVADINFREICEKLLDGSIDQYIEEQVDCGFCWGRHNTVMDDMLADKIAEDISDRKIIFLSINCEEYCMDREEEEGYCAHGACAMLVPKRGGYNLYYMNPHGEVMKDYTYFEKIKTRTRCTQLKFDGAIIDCVVMKTLADYCNKKFDTNIYYDYTMAHNYFGVNLQEEDNHGMCFIFPSIVYYYFGKYFTEKRELVCCGPAGNETQVLPSFKEMLDTGKFNLAIHSCFMDFNPTIKMRIFTHLRNQETHEQLVEKLIAVLSKSKSHFLKNVTNTMVSFINQDYFLKKIKMDD